ncbi:MAG TPA: hypothetical protein VHU23_14335 [Rhizomicrobium sp.]|jgi:hypothetical protein|nr:hypothetical protein [Rhizomicrobium sp.]
MAQNSVQSSKLREDIVKKALDDVDWPALKAHLDAIAFTADVLKELCGHIQRYSDWNIFCSAKERCGGKTRCRAGGHQ